MEHAGEKTVAMPLRPASSSASLVRTTISTLGKDLRLEWRSKDALNAMLFFALLVVVIFSFAFEPTAEEARRITGGLVWVAFLFSSTMALNQSWARELRHQSLDAFRISGAPADALFLGKAIGNFIFVALLEAIVAPLFVVFFNLTIAQGAGALLWVFVLGTWALVVNGAFFAALSLRTRNRPRHKQQLAATIRKAVPHAPAIAALRSIHGRLCWLCASSPQVMGEPTSMCTDSVLGVAANGSPRSF